MCDRNAEEPEDGDRVGVDEDCIVGGPVAGVGDVMSVRMFNTSFTEGDGVLVEECR
jgi:hypothetical protein